MIFYIIKDTISNEYYVERPDRAGSTSVNFQSAILYSTVAEAQQDIDRSAARNLKVVAAEIDLGMVTLREEQSSLLNPERKAQTMAIGAWLESYYRSIKSILEIKDIEGIVYPSLSFNHLNLFRQGYSPDDAADETIGAAIRAVRKNEEPCLWFSEEIKSNSEWMLDHKMSAIALKVWSDVFSKMTSRIEVVQKVRQASRNEGKYKSFDIELELSLLGCTEYGNFNVPRSLMLEVAQRLIVEESLENINLIAYLIEEPSDISESDPVRAMLQETIELLINLDIVQGKTLPGLGSVETGATISVLTFDEDAILRTDVLIRQQSRIYKPKETALQLMFPDQDEKISAYFKSVYK